MIHFEIILENNKIRLFDQLLLLLLLLLILLKYKKFFSFKSNCDMSSQTEEFT